jgi:hypothetical protein
MDVYELIKQVGAEIVCNRATARIDGKFVVVAAVSGDAFALTPEGEEIAATLKPVPKKTTAKKTTANKAGAGRKRARNTDGTLKADDPSTPNVNEAWTNGDS